THPGHARATSLDPGRHEVVARWVRCTAIPVGGGGRRGGSGGRTGQAPGRVSGRARTGFSPSTLSTVIELGSRARPQPAPAHIVWRSLVYPHDPTARPWLDLLADETGPRILESVEPTLVVWSSLWPDLIDATIRFDIEPGEQGCQLRWTLLSTG